MSLLLMALATALTVLLAVLLMHLTGGFFLTHHRTNPHTKSTKKETVR